MSLLPEYDRHSDNFQRLTSALQGARADSCRGAGTDSRRETSRKVENDARVHVSIESRSF